MSAEFRTQYLPATIATSGTAVTLNAVNGDFVAVDDPTRTMVLPAGSWHHTAGLGWDTGSFQVALREHMVSADLGDDNTLTFTRGFAGLAATRAGVTLVEYIGPAGGANEFIRRHKQTVTLAAASITVDSSAISGVVSFAKLLPIALVRTDANTNDTRHTDVTVDVINTSGTYTVRLTRAGNSGTINATVYVYELTGANFTSERVGAAISVAATTQTQTLSTSVSASTNFVIRTSKQANASGGPANSSVLCWASGTTFSARVPAISTTSYIAYVVNNPSMAVQQILTPDGTNDWAAGTGSAEQTQTFSFSAVDASRAAVVGQAGSDDTTANNHGSELFNFKLTSTTAGSARRGRSFGGTEHVVQVLQFPQDLPNITGITATIRTGSNVVVDGTKLKPAGVAGTLKMSGTSLSLSATSDTQYTGAAAIGTSIFGSQEWQIETTVGVASIAHDILPPSGEAYFDLFGGLSSTGVITAIPALLETAQIWAKELKDSASVTKDVTNTALFRILPDGRPELDASISVPATVKLAANNNNGSGWGAFATITIDTNVAKPVVDTIPPLALSVGTEVQFDLSLYASGEETVVIATGALPPGLSITDEGFVVGTPTSAGTYTVTVEYENDAGPEVSPDFVLSVYVAPRATEIPPFYYRVGEAVSFDLTDYGSDFDSVLLIGSLPPGLEYASGVITGTPTVAGVYGAMARFTNAGPTPAESNIFRMVEGRGRVRQMTSEQASPRRRRNYQ